MSFDWDKHATCWASKAPGDLPRGTGPCETDRAAVIAAGRRLEADEAHWHKRAMELIEYGDTRDIENAKLAATCVQQRDRIAALEQELLLRRETETQLRGALEVAEQWMTTPSGHGCVCKCPVIDGHASGCVVSAALAGATP